MRSQFVVTTAVVEVTAATWQLGLSSLVVSLNLQDLYAAVEVGPTNVDDAVEPSGPHQRRIQNISPVRRMCRMIICR